MQKHTLCCSIVFLRALLKKDSKLKVFHFSLLSCLRGAICKAGRKKHFRWECFSDFPCFFPSTLVWVENRRNATWEGHILTTSCCVQNGSEAALFQPITKAPSLTPFHPSTQRVITRKYIFNNFPPTFRSCCETQQHRMYMLCALCGVHRKLFKGDEEERSIPLPFTMNSERTKNIKVSFLHSDREREETPLG